MFSGMKDMGKLLKQANEMKKKLKDMQENLKSMTFTHEKEGIHILINGEMEILKFELSGDFLTKNDAKKASQLIKDAVNQSVKTAKTKAASQLNDITGGLSLPGF